MCCVCVLIYEFLRRKSTRRDTYLLEGYDFVPARTKIVVKLLTSHLVLFCNFQTTCVGAIKSMDIVCMHVSKMYVKYWDMILTLSGSLGLRQ